MMSESHIKSMLMLLEDPDPKVYKQIRENIFNNVAEVKPFLNDCRRLSSDILFQTRIQMIADEIDTMNSVRQLEHWSERENPELIDALMIAQEAFFPEYDTLRTLNAFKALRQKIWMELNQNQTAIEKVKIINKVVYEEFGLKALNAQNVLTSHLCCEYIFMYQKANNLMQTLLYASLAQSIKLPVFPVILPDLFVLGYKDNFIANMSFASEQHYDVVFYIHPYESGALFSKNVIQKYLESKNVDELPMYFSPIDNRKTMLVYLRLLQKTIAADNRQDYRNSVIQQMINFLDIKK